ncbi:MAG: hypothetical protein L0K86_20820 [Actinomycetia bacterium]|nr:hypothetical protein [Actinomycetes bacterium]
MSGMHRLQQAGFDIDRVRPEQREVLESLSDAEIRTLVGMKDRLDNAAGDVEGHAPPDDWSG